MERISASLRAVIEFLVAAVAALVAIAVANLAGPRVGIAPPLILVSLGIAASFLPTFADFEIDPEVILQGVLPALLYAAAVSMPTTNFRREFGAISGLSVLLVVISSLALGGFFFLVIPGIGFAWGVALGAIVSPTDAVATSIIKRSPVSQRVVAMLDGESMLNDATALVLLRGAIAATAAGFSLVGAAGAFVYSVIAAVVIGVVVGHLVLAARRTITDSTVSTVISFVAPFLASIPAELIGSSGLVAAAVAGLLTAVRAPRALSPEVRVSDQTNWRTIDLVLQGLVFLTMGLELRSVLSDVTRDHAGVASAVLIACGALLLALVIRAAYVAPLLGYLDRRVRRGQRMQPHLESMQEALADTDRVPARRAHWWKHRRCSASPEEVERFSQRLTRLMADIDYFSRQPLGWRDGLIVVWAGMRGAVTVAAAQTLPPNTPSRSLLILIAFAVALLSLVVQGGTVGALVRALTSHSDMVAAQQDAAEQRTQIMTMLREVAQEVPRGPEPPEEADRRAVFEAERAHRIAVLEAQRGALLDARDNGTYDAEVLQDLLADLDASQIAIEMRGRSSDER